MIIVKLKVNKTIFLFHWSINTVLFAYISLLSIYFTAL